MFPQDPWNGQQPANRPGEPGGPTGPASYGPGGQQYGPGGGQYGPPNNPYGPSGAFPGGGYQGDGYQGSGYRGGYPPAPQGQAGYPPGYADPTQQAYPAPGGPPSGPSRTGRVIALVVGAAVLVAALTVTLVLVLRPKPVADPGTTVPGTTASTQIRPVEPSAITTPSSLPSVSSESTSSESTSSAESSSSSSESTSTSSAAPTTAPTTPTPTTSRQTTSSRPTSPKPSTTRSTPKTTGPDYVAIQKAATAGAKAWADAVNTGNYDGVVAHSCQKDQAGYKSGGLTNPAILGGHNTFTVQTTIATQDKGIAVFKIAPAINGHTTETVRLLNEAGWRVCLS